MAPTEEIWPAASVISDRARALITRFFDISNSTDPKSGKLMADEVFHKDGIFTTHRTLVSKGYDEIAASREKNDPAIVSHDYKLFKVYAANSPGTDILVVGSLNDELKDGKWETFGFAARFIVSEKEGEERLQFVQFWTDLSDMVATVGRASELLGKK